MSHCCQLLKKFSWTPVPLLPSSFYFSFKFECFHLRKKKVYGRSIFWEYKQKPLLTILHLDLTTEISLDNEYLRHPVNVSFLPYSLQNGQFQRGKGTSLYMGRKKQTKLLVQIFLSWGEYSFWVIFRWYNTVLQNYGSVCALGKVGNENCVSTDFCLGCRACDSS